MNGWLRASHRAGVRIAALVLAMLVVPTPNDGRSTVPVDLVLILALDVSGSVDGREFNLQRKGLADAFRSPKLTDAIRRGAKRRIAVLVIQWAGAGQQSVSVPWTIVRGKASADRFSNRLRAITRRYQNGQTDIAGMLEFATGLALSAPLAAARRVIDVSGDGLDNVRYATHEQRDAAVRAGLTVNGLAIVNETPRLDEYYRAYVIGGPEAFVITATDYEDYLDAILLKLLREINLRFAS